MLKHSADGWIVKIVDFGLSNTHEGGKLLSTACGSPCYAAPEMIAGKQYVGPVADIWSMGVILFALVCGFLPFEDANTSNLYRKIMAGEYKPAKWISSDVKDLIRRILETDPRRRYSVSDIRRHPWYQLAPDSSIPRDVVDSEKTKAETMQSMTDAGMDVQAVLDGIQSHACNSITAMYYLLAQKSRGAFRGKVALDKDKMQNLIKSTAAPPAVAAGPQAAPLPVLLQPSPQPYSAPSPFASAGPVSNSAPEVLPTANPAGDSSQQQQQQQQQPQQQQQQQQQPQLQPQQPESNRRSRTPTPTRAQGKGGGELGMDAVGGGAGYMQGRAGGIPVRTAAPPPAAGVNTARGGAALVGGSTYQQGGSSVLQKLQQQHQQRMNNTAMPSLDVYMGASGSGNDPARVGKMPSHVPPVVPKLNFRSPALGADKVPLVSKTARPQSKGATPQQSKQQQQQQPKQLQQQSYSARAPLPSDTPHSFDMAGLSTELAAVPMPADLLGPGPDADIERPSTRRSRLRSRGGDYAPEGDARPQSAAGGLDVPNDAITNAAPVVMHNADGTDATSTLRVVHATQPDAGLRSSAPSGGRKGKNIKGPSSSSAEEAADPFPLPAEAAGLVA